MACIRVSFPKIGYETSTWVPDEEWVHLTKQQKNAMIFRYIKNHYAKELRDAQLQTIPKSSPNYRWSEI